MYNVFILLAIGWHEWSCNVINRDPVIIMKKFIIINVLIMFIILHLVNCFLKHLNEGGREA